MNKYVIIDKDKNIKQVDAKTALAHFKEEKAIIEKSLEESKDIVQSMMAITSCLMLDEMIADLEAEVKQAKKPSKKVVKEKAKTSAKKRGRPAKKPAVVSKKGTKPSKIEKPAPKKRGRPAKSVKPVSVVKKIKKELKKKGK